MDEPKHLNTPVLADHPESPRPEPRANAARAGGDWASAHRKLWMALGIAAIVLIAALVVWRLREHAAGEAVSATPVAAVAPAAYRDLYNIYPIDAEFRPYAEVELHAKVSGYVDKMNVDFGDKVKAGQLLATLEVPELRDQLNNALAVQRKAEADYTNAHLIYTRMLSVSRQHPDLVAQQDLDSAQAKDASSAAAIAAAKAEAERYQTLINYTKITAPFDGVITHRYVDPGALIQAGTSSDTQSLPLVRVSDNYHLRLDFPVPVEYVKDIHEGEPVEVRVESLHGKTFKGSVCRYTYRVNDATRTMNTELELDNSNLEIVPGMYAEVDLKVQQRDHALSIPLQALGGDKEPSVYVVNANHEIEVRPVKVGVENSYYCEIVSGLKEGDLVMIGNRTMVQPGQRVETKMIEEPAAQ